MAAESTEELNYKEALDWFGLRFRPADTGHARAWLGAATRNDAGRLVVRVVRRDTPAFAAGLNVDDEILAIDDVRVRADGLAARLEQYKPSDKVACWWPPRPADATSTLPSARTQAGRGALRRPERHR